MRRYRIRMRIGGMHAAMLAACAGEAARPDGQSPDGHPPDSVPETEQACWIDTVIGAELGDIAPMDCGHLEFGADDGRLAAAHDCAVAANAGHVPFLVRWEIPGVDSHVVGAYLGRMQAGAWTVRSFTYDSLGPNGAMVAQTSTQVCGTLDDLGACGFHLRDMLCLECANVIASTRCE